jgi:excisionase family DNA binding protein
MPEFLTRAEVAQLLRISPRSVERWVQVGRLPPAVKLSGRTLRFRSADIDKYLREAGLTEKDPEATPAM